MTTIWKYQLPLQDDFELELPKFAKVLSVGAQNDMPVIWVQVIVDEPEKEIRKFCLAGTGQHMNGKHQLTFIGTFQILEGRFVGHVFEKTSNGGN